METERIALRQRERDRLGVLQEVKRKLSRIGDLNFRNHCGCE